MKSLQITAENSRNWDDVYKVFSKAEKIPVASLDSRLELYKVMISSQAPFTFPLEEAISFATRFPGFYNAELYVAKLLARQKKYQESLFWCEKAIDFHPLEEENYEQKRSVHLILGNLKDAREAKEETEKIRARNLNRMEIR